MASQETAPVDSYRQEEVYYDRGFHLPNLSVPQQCEDDPYGFNAIMVIGDSSFPIRRCHPFHIPALDPGPLPEPHNDATLDQSETDSEEVGIMGAMSELSGPPVASTMRARVGGLAPVHRSSGPINGVEPLEVSMETGQAEDTYLQPMGADEEEGGRGKRKTRNKDNKKRRKRRQRHISR